MRRLSILALLVGLAGSVGCEALHERLECRRSLHCGETPVCEKVVAPVAAPAPPPVSAPPPVAAPPPQVAAPAPVPVIAQDILLVPKTVYMPYAAQTPVAVARVSQTALAQQVGAPGPQPTPPQVGNPQVANPQPTPQLAPEPCVPDATRQMLDCCRRLEDRMNQMERSMADRPVTIVNTPPACAAPSCPTGLLRWPLFRRSSVSDPCNSCGNPACGNPACGNPACGSEGVQGVPAGGYYAPTISTPVPVSPQSTTNGPVLMPSTMPTNAVPGAPQESPMIIIR
jgi:hypothetical protein